LPRASRRPGHHPKGWLEHDSNLDPFASALSGAPGQARIANLYLSGIPGAFYPTGQKYQSFLDIFPIGDLLSLRRGYINLQMKLHSTNTAEKDFLSGDSHADKY